MRVCVCRWFSRAIPRRVQKCDGSLLSYPPQITLNPEAIAVNQQYAGNAGDILTNATRSGVVAADGAVLQLPARPHPVLTKCDSSTSEVVPEKGAAERERERQNERQRQKERKQPTDPGSSPPQARRSSGRWTRAATRASSATRTCTAIASTCKTARSPSFSSPSRRRARLGAPKVGLCTSAGGRHDSHGPSVHRLTAL